MTFFLFFNIVFLKIQPLVYIFNLCFLVFLINFVPLRIQSPVPIFTWEQDTGWIALSLFGLSFFSTSRLFLLPPPSLLYPTLWISLCVPDGGEHLGNWLDYWPDLSLSFWFPPLSSWPPLSPSSLFSSLYNSVNTSERSSCGMHIRKWLLASEFDSTSSHSGHL